MSNENIKKAFGDAEKELQQEEIEKIKGVVRSYLEEIQEKQDKRKKKQAEIDEIDEEIKLLKKDLDDLKAGRLDRMEERQRIDKKARDNSIIIIKKIEKEYVPYKPWYSPYEIIWSRPQQPLYPDINNRMYCSNSTYGDIPQVGYSAANLLSSSFEETKELMDHAMTVTGSLMQNFVGGSYDINGKIINL
jgi:hypothetical protein